MRRRLGLYIQFHKDNINGEKVVDFLRCLLRHLRGHVVLLWDRGTIHRKSVVNEFLEHNQRLSVHKFPSYAPELNPDEFVWTYSKGRLANSAPRNRGELSRMLRDAIRRIRTSPQLLRSCITASDLPWRF